MDKGKLTIPGPSVHGPPTKAMMRAPVPGKQAPNKPAATLKATAVHLVGRFPISTGH